tara:strand:+ start:3779 stop:4024 length:246 start_codon:yes stop_codon:yes gene_type:complete
VDLNGVTTFGDMLTADAPIGAWIIRIPDGSNTRVVEAHVQALSLAFSDHGFRSQQVPEQFIGHSPLHRLSPSHPHGPPGGA